MFVRYVTEIRDRCSHQKLGVLRAARRLEDCMSVADWECLERHFAWLRRHLRVPHRFARSRKRHAEKKAICWFKEGAGASIARVRAIAYFLQKYGVPTALLSTHRPGYIVYEDRLQIAAVPFRDTVVQVRPTW
jgi:hypothetical protein